MKKKILNKVSTRNKILVLRWFRRPEYRHKYSAFCIKLYKFLLIWTLSIEYSGLDWHKNPELLQNLSKLCEKKEKETNNEPRIQGVVTPVYRNDLQRQLNLILDVKYLSNKKRFFQAVYSSALS